ncbi:MAG: hypothetical protein HYZ79_03000 [Candidatus Melainabacteria bacterium]|nr:hypothetical protein [Candidatus Melainabacteria bacterium]
MSLNHKYMRITRREFLPTFAALAAGIPSFLKAEENDNSQISLADKEKQLDKLSKNQEVNSDLIKTLRWIDPNLSSLVINLSYAFSEPIVFHRINYKKFKQGIGDITEADLIHNNSDKWANAMASAVSYFLAYSVRFPFTAWAAKDSLESPDEVKRQNKVFSDFMTINTYYGQTIADRYLTNTFQHELREAYKKLLRENPTYELQPWAIPLSETVEILRSIYPPVAKGISSDVVQLRKDVSKLKDKEVAIEWMKSRRNQLDLLLVFLSYASTFVDIVPLITADNVQIYTANTATGRMVANLPCQALLCKDLLKRLKDKGDLEGYNEERVMATAGLYNVPTYFVINSSIQALVDSGLGFKEYTDRDVAYSNLREIVGSVTGCIIYMFIQYNLESAMRSNIKNHEKGLVKEHILTKFADWYLKPDPKD